MKEIEKELLEALYLKEGRSIRDMAGLLGWSKDKVYRLLKKHGIKRDKRIRKGKLANISLHNLEREFNAKTKKQVAKELGISRATLYNYLNKLRKT